MAQEINWDDPKYQTSGYSLVFYNQAGQVAQEGEPAETKPVEYANAEEELNPKFQDKNGRIQIKFTFIDPETSSEKFKTVAVGSRFFKAMQEARQLQGIQLGDKVVIRRTGAKMQTFYTVVKATPPTA